MKEDNREISHAFGHNIFSALYLLLIIFSIYYLNQEQKLNRDISWFEFTLLSLATFRLIRLFVYDTITEHIRSYLEKYDYGFRKELSNLIQCPWCTGVWAGLFVAFIFFFHPLARFFILALALAGIGSFLQIVIWKIGLERRKTDE
jgi:uncharacterized membrane protein